MLATTHRAPSEDKLAVTAEMLLCAGYLLGTC
jgi:hypothetical protein